MKHSIFWRSDWFLGIVVTLGAAALAVGHLNARYCVDGSVCAEPATSA